MHKNLGRTPGSENIFFLLGMFISFIILTWFQMYRWKSTIPSCRYSHCYCWWNFKISHRKQPRLLADARVNFERPAQVSISGDCIAITWRHLIYFFFTAPAESWINGVFHSDDNHAVFPIMTTVTAPQNRNQQTENCLWNHMQWPITSHCHKLATHGILRSTDIWTYGIENIFPRLIESTWSMPLGTSKLFGCWVASCPLVWFPCWFPL